MYFLKLKYQTSTAAHLSSQGISLTSDFFHLYLIIIKIENNNEKLPIM